MPTRADRRGDHQEPDMKTCFDDIATGLMVATLSLASVSMLVVVAFGAA
jgi:hypothetical protein